MDPIFTIVSDWASFQAYILRYIHTNASALSIWHAAKSTRKACEPGDIGSWLGGNQIFLGVALLWVSRLNEKGSLHHKVSLRSPQPILPHALRCVVSFCHLLNIYAGKLFNTVHFSYALGIVHMTSVCLDVNMFLPEIYQVFSSVRSAK